MELWIRSQDKKRFMKVETLFITNDEDKKYSICGYFSQGLQKGAFGLGTYNSEKRALEILDEIQNCLYNQKSIEHLANAGMNMDNIYPIIMYEMPKE